MAVRKVIVVGGGVAGTATALALLKVGIEAEVYEAYPSGGADAGAFLTVMRNGMAALAGSVRLRRWTRCRFRRGR